VSALPRPRDPSRWTQSLNRMKSRVSSSGPNGLHCAVAAARCPFLGSNSAHYRRRRVDGVECSATDRSLKSNDSATRRRGLLVGRAQQMMLARTLKRKRTSAAGRLLRRRLPWQRTGTVQHMSINMFAAIILATFLLRRPSSHAFTYWCAYILL